LVSQNWARPGASLWWSRTCLVPTVNESLPGFLTGSWFKSEIPAMAKIVKDGKVTVE
jgi:hypothetical protein